MEEKMLMKHHLIEYVSKGELLSLLNEIDTFNCSTNEGMNYISLSAPGLQIFFIAREDSCKDEWNDENCSDHLVIHSLINGVICGKYELALHFMKMSVEEFSIVLAGHINSLFLQLQKQQNVLPRHSHIPQSTRENNLATSQSRDSSEHVHFQDVSGTAEWFAGQTLQH